MPDDVREVAAEPVKASPAKPARKSKLLAVSPEHIEPRKPKVLIYGPAGVGKTWTALDFPNVYYFDTEGGADLSQYREKLKAAGGMYFGPDQGSLDFDAVIGQVEALATEDHPYKTMVFDSITKLFNAAITDEQIRMENAGKKDEFGASKKGPVRQMARLIRWINRADMNAIVIAHQKPLWGMNNGQREEIGQTFDAWEKLEYELHLVMRIAKIGTGETAKRYAHIGKSRLVGFAEGSKIDWSYPQFAERYGKDVIEKDGTRLVLATAEQVADIERLVKAVKLPEGWLDKWFAKEGVDSYAEMDTARIAKGIDYLTKLKESAP